MNKTELESAIIKDFPDINHTEFVINGHGVEGFVQQRLLPFLIYQNTMDSSSRLIGLFLAENSSSMHFLPFYIAYGFYRKAVDRIFNNSSFSAQEFNNQQRQVTERTSGNVCSITSVNFINRSLTIRTGTGRMVEIPFEHDYRLNWNYQQSMALKNSIRDFERLFSASSKHIFAVPISARDEHEGIVVFTQVSKFETLLSGVSISGQSLNENLHIGKTVFGKTDKIGYKQLSARKTAQRPITVLLSRSDSLMAYHNIIDSDPVRYSRLNTVVIDDFDLMLSREIGNGSVVEFLDNLDEVFFSRLGSSIRDIYLVCRDRNFNLNEILKQHHVAVKPWLLTPEQQNTLDGISMPREITIRHFRDSAYTHRIYDLESLIDQWRTLSIHSPCQGELLPVISVLYRIREKVISFYEPASLAGYSQSLSGILSGIKTKWFSSGQDNRLINNTLDFVGNIGDGDHQSSISLRTSLRTIMCGEFQRLIVVTNNDNSVDHQWLSQDWDGEIDFITASRFISGDFKADTDRDAILHLCWSRQIADKILTARLLPYQNFLLDERGFAFLRSYLPKAWKRLNTLSPESIRYELLNLKATDHNPLPTVFPAHISFHQANRELSDADSDAPAKDESSPEIHPFLDFEQTIGLIVKSSQYNGLGVSSDATRVTVYFQDGTHRDFTTGSWLYFFEEETTLSELQKEVGSLKNGDLVILPKSRTEIRKLLEEVLGQNEFFARLVAEDHEWRLLMDRFLQRTGSTVEDLRLMLAAEHVDVVSPKTIQNWIDGETLEPRKFEALLRALSNLQILPMEKLNAYRIGAKALKQQKSTFIRSAIRKLIYTMKGISYAVTDFDEELLNRFLDHVEMKKVLTVTADKYAN